MIGPVEGRTIAGLLAPGGTVAHVFQGLEARSGQLVMAQAVQSALDGEEPVLIEAPCGIGKSLTYLLGAALAAESGKKTLVVTANIALQEQLIRKDISLVPSNHLILCRPLLLLPSIFPSIRVFSNELALRIRWPNDWGFSFHHQSF